MAGRYFLGDGQVCGTTRSTAKPLTRRNELRHMQPGMLGAADAFPATWISRVM